jgi:hypothetical protein
MKMLLALSAAALACACATTPPDQYAENDCRVAPVVTADSSLRRPDRVTDLDRRYAEMQLATSDYRLRQLQRDPAYATNNIEQSLQGCARK